MGDRGRSREITCYSFPVVFANDNLIDAMEVAFLEKLALEDGRVGEKERDVLRRSSRAPADEHHRGWRLQAVT